MEGESLKGLSFEMTVAREGFVEAAGLTSAAVLFSDLALDSGSVGVEEAGTEAGDGFDDL